MILHFCPDPDERFAAANTKFEWVYGHFDRAVDRWISVANILPSATTILLCYIVHGKFDVAYLFHPIKIHLPWDQTTPIGYFAELGFSILNMEIYWIVGCQVLLLFVFLCKNNFIFSAMFVSFLDEFDQTREIQKKCDLIRKIIGFHMNIKR